MKLSFFGAAHEVTGSCTLLEACGYKILIDCGMEQGADTYENRALPVSPKELDCILLTHAHIDHSGRLPALVAGGFNGKIYATAGTGRLCGIMLMDSAHIQESEAEWRNRKAKRSGKPEYVPLYTRADAEKTLSLFVPCAYQTEYQPLSGIVIRFLDAGHLLGSASIEIRVTENGETKTILFSGDIGNVDRPLIRDPQKPEQADFVIVESTYGMRRHAERKDYRGQLAGIIQETLDRGGNVIIPAFAVGRTQELLYLIHEIKVQGLVTGHDGFPVWVDSPLAVEATKIYDGSLMDYYDEETLALIRSGEDVLRFDGLHMAVTKEESVAINRDAEPKVILSASGMCEAGRIRHHLKHNLWRKESTILFVGYQSAGTLGRMLLDGADSVKLFGETITVAAQIAQMDGISGHGDQDILLCWLDALQTPPTRVFVNHGEDDACDGFAELITRELGYPALAPYSGAVYDLQTGACLDRGNMKRIDRSKLRERVAGAAFEKLVKAGRRMLTAIERNRDSSTDSLVKFAAQLNALCSRWEK